MALIINMVVGLISWATCGLNFFGIINDFYPSNIAIQVIILIISRSTLGYSAAQHIAPPESI